MDAPTITKYSNRTHPMFQGQNCTNTLNLGITTKCSMKCPNCTIDVPGVKARGEDEDALMSQVFNDAIIMAPLRRVHVTGGEPTLHKFFGEMCGQLRRWFDCQYLTLETNGFGYRKHKEAINTLFDLVFITHYLKDTIYPGNPDNTEIIAEAQRDLGDRLIVEEPVTHGEAHLTIQSKLSLRATTLRDAMPCSKHYEPGLPAGWYNGRLYKCCVTFGIDKTLGMRVTDRWKEDVVKLQMGCAACTYRGT